MLGRQEGDRQQALLSPSYTSKAEALQLTDFAQSSRGEARAGACGCSQTPIKPTIPGETLWSLPLPNPLAEDGDSPSAQGTVSDVV